MSTSTSVDFYYFPIRARGETSRILMHLAGQKFNDIHIGVDADHPNQMHKVAEKESSCGLFPIARIDGELFGDSMAISRYYATLAGLGGRDAKEWLLLDCIVNYMHDAITPIWPLTFNRFGYNEEEMVVSKKKKSEEAVEKSLKILRWIDGRIGEKGGPFVSGEHFSWVDIFIGEAMRTICGWPGYGESFLKFVNLVKLMEAYEKRPEIKKWRDDHQYSAPL